MPQIFPRYSNLLARVTLFGSLVVLAGVAWLGWTIYKSPYYTQVDMPKEQPIPFSHKHHVQDDGIDCRYCHKSVENASTAGMPDTETCLSCHSQIFKDSPMLEPVRASMRTGIPIAWNRVHNLPNYVYFNHGIHIQKGIGCVTCHGRVDEMPIMMKKNSLYMEWCLSCHRGPQEYLRPQSQVFSMTWTPTDQQKMGAELLKIYHILPTHQLSNCSVCHR
jgi:hypothetical protein